MLTRGESGETSALGNHADRSGLEGVWEGDSGRRVWTLPATSGKMTGPVNPVLSRCRQALAQGQHASSCLTWATDCVFGNSHVIRKRTNAWEGRGAASTGQRASVSRICQGGRKNFRRGLSCSCWGFGKREG